MTIKISVLTRLGLGIGMFAASTSMALAQSASDSVGIKLKNALESSSGPLFIAIAGVAWLAGLYLLISGLNKLANASEGGGRGEGAASGLVRLAVGIMMFALPDVAGIGMSSMFGVNASSIFGGASELKQISQSLDVETGSGSGSMSSGTSMMNAGFGRAGNPETPENCYAGSAGVTCMAKNIAKNFVPIGIYAIYTICFLTGLAMFGSSLWTASKAYGQGSQGLPPGFWAKAATALLLINSPLLITAVATTLQGQGGVLSIDGFNAGSNFLSYSFQQTQGTSSTSEILQKFNELIGYVLVILAFFGVWAFFKGIFMVKASSEGKSQGTMGGGLVFMVGGVMLANAKISTCMIMYTFGGSGMTFGFCSG